MWTSSQWAKCPLCVTYHDTLRKSCRQWLKQKALSPWHCASTSGRTALCFLNTPEKSVLHPVEGSTWCEVKRGWKNKIEKCCNKRESGVQLGELSSDFTVDYKYPEGSFRRLFWDEQVKALGKSDTRQINGISCINTVVPPPQIHIFWSILCHQ